MIRVLRRTTVRKAIKMVSFYVYRMALRLRFVVYPYWYHSPAVSVLELKRNRALWARKSELPGIEVDLDAQVERLKATCLPYRSEYADAALHRHATEMQLGPGYRDVDFAVWYSTVRRTKPSRVVEVGSGVSTFATLEALRKNEEEGGPTAHVLSVEPYPSTALRGLEGIQLVEQPVQAVPLEVFESLRPNDMLFIDSTHTVKPGGDVNYLVLEVLPRLHPGVIVHIDDISLPFDYGPDALTTFYHWSETSLLRAFLIHNSNVRILYSLRHILVERRDVFLDCFPGYEIGVIPPDGLFEDRYGPFQNPPGTKPESIYLTIL
jgi:predicted O-methyltransferase YrrM